MATIWHVVVCRQPRDYLRVPSVKHSHVLSKMAGAMLVEAAWCGINHLGLPYNKWVNEMTRER